MSGGCPLHGWRLPVERPDLCFRGAMEMDGDGLTWGAEMAGRGVEGLDQ